LKKAIDVYDKIWATDFAITIAKAWYEKDKSNAASSGKGRANYRNLFTVHFKRMLDFNGEEDRLLIQLTDNQRNRTISLSLEEMLSGSRQPSLNNLEDKLTSIFNSLVVSGKYSRCYYRK